MVIAMAIAAEKKLKYRQMVGKKNTKHKQKDIKLWQQGRKNWEEQKYKKN